MSPGSRLRPLFRLPYLPLILAPLILFSPIFLTGKALFWGTPALQFVPWWSWAWETLQSGHLPLWNPLVGMGAPLLANYQSALFYPPNWLYFLLAAVGGVPALAWGLAVSVSAHLIWAGVGMSRLVQRLGLGVTAQTVAGLAFGLSGYLVARAGFLSITTTAAWVPWVMAAVLDLSLHGPGFRRLAWLGALWGLQLLAGHAQTSWYTWLLAFAWAGFWGWANTAPGDDDAANRYRAYRGLKGLARAWGWLAMSLVLGVALAAVQLFPTAEYLLQSQRAGAVDYDFAMTYSFWPWRLLTLVAPDLFGNPAHGDYWGYGAFWEDAVYVGLLPLLMGLRALVRRGRLPGPAAGSGQEPVARHLPALSAGLGLLTGIAFLLALGGNTPIFPWLFHYVPGFDMFQAPARLTLWAEFALPLLAAIGVEGWRRPQARGLYWTRLATAGALAVMIGAGLTWYLLGDVRPTFIRAATLAGFWGVGIGLLALRAPQQDENGQRRWWPWAISALLAADLLVAGWGLNPGVGLDFYQGRAPTAPVVQRLAGDGRLYLAAGKEYSLKFERFLRFDTFSPAEDWLDLRAALLPNLHLLDGLDHSANFDPLVPGRYSRWMAALAEMAAGDRERALDLMAVQVVENEDPASPHGVRFEPHAGGERLRWVPCGREVQGAARAWELVFSTAFDPTREVVVETSQTPPCQADGRGEALMMEETPNRIDLTTHATAGGWVVLADVWYPGWRAAVDGQSLPILPANYLFRALWVPAGDHQVTISYRPFWFYLGALVSTLSWLGLGIRYARRPS